MPLAEPRSLVAARPTKPVAAAWAKKVPAPTSTRPVSTAGRFGSSSSGKPMPATARPTPERRPGSRTAHRAAGKRRRDDRGQEDEVDQAELHHADASGGRASTKLT